jgi:hypothetical protein
MSTKNEIENAEILLSAMAGGPFVCQALIRRPGDHCYFCGDGAGAALAACHCGLSESLECGGQKLCADCRSAHRTVASHLKEMFSAKISDRSSSIRLKKYYQLHTAGEVCDEQNPHVERAAPRDQIERSLASAIAQVHPTDDEHREFKAGILGAFAALKFNDYQGLAKALQAEKDAELKYRLARYFSSCVR